MNTEPIRARRVLIVTYYFPPSGGSGVQRPLKFVRYLRDVGWEPVVLTVEGGAYPAHDPSLMEDIPEGVAVHRTASWDPFAWYARLTGASSKEAVKIGSVESEEPTWMEKLARWIRANVFLPDARVGWVPFAVAEGRRLLSDPRIRAVVTTGPPHSVHLTGWILHRWSERPWVADFRDPWTDINYYHELPHTAWASRFDAMLERAVLQHADAVTTVSPFWRRLLEGKEPTGTTRFQVVHNGFDEEDFTAQEVPSADEFVLTYTGSLYASRDPVTLWRVLGDLREQNALPKLRIRLVGSVDPSVRDSLQRFGLDAIAEYVSYVPHEEAVAYMQAASLLLLVIEEFQAEEGMITGKLYEYLASGRPVLGIGSVSGDAAELLRETEGGHMLERGDAEGMAAFVQAHYAAWDQGHPRSGASPERVQPYSRQAQTEVLAGVLDQCVMRTM